MGKRLVVCCDGTWNTAGQERNGVLSPTNVYKLTRTVPEAGADGVRQLTFYRQGVGTNPWDRLRGGAFGVGLSRNVLRAYEFLVQNFEPGDEIFLFGFSRGAFTVRSLAGLIRNSGILRSTEIARIPDAWSLYRGKEKPSHPKAEAFRQAHAHETRIRFIGVWDTVGELGIPMIGPQWLKPLGHLINRPWEFHDTQLSSWVDGAFHALAIDEQRSVFEPTLWHQQPDAVGQVLEQVWFTGVHCSVGGGLADSSLSDLALIWMAEKAAGFGLEFAPGAFDPQASPPEGVFAVAPDPLATFETSRTGFYRLTKRHHRPIGQAGVEESGPPDGNESVAPSAQRRYQQDADYRPPELVEYLGRVPDAG